MDPIVKTQNWRFGFGRLSRLAGRLKRRKVTWGEGAKGQLAARFALVRVWPGHDWRQGKCADADPVRLIIEEQADARPGGLLALRPEPMPYRR